MYIAALILTVIGWLFQGYETIIKKSRNVSIFLPATYCVACILWGINSFNIGDALYGVLDIGVAILTALITLYLVNKK
jgi:hypothetical protein